MANLKNPNSRQDTFLICVANSNDNHENLQTIIKPIKQQIDKLDSMNISLERQGIHEEKTLIMSLFCDNEFETKMYRLSGAAGFPPCLNCTATKGDI